MTYSDLVNSSPQFGAMLVQMIQKLYSSEIVELTTVETHSPDVITIKGRYLNLSDTVVPFAQEVHLDRTTGQLTARWSQKVVHVSENDGNYHLQSFTRTGSF